MLNDLFVNLCILGMLFCIFNLVTTNSKGFISPDSGLRSRIQFGLCMGCLGIILMYHTIPYKSTILDLRQIPIVIAAIYGGFVPSLAAAIVIAGGRIALFEVNKASLFATVLVLLIGISNGALSKLRMSRRNKWLVITVSNLILTSLVFLLLVKDRKTLINIYVGFWFVSVSGGFIMYYLAEYLRQSTELFQKAEENAATDFLTGLNNVRKFDEVLKHSIAKADKHNEQVSFILLDIDHFKDMNDKYGHQSGDEILKQLSEVLNHSCRSIDIVSRNGGEEFSIILPSCGKIHAMEVAERTRAAVEQYPFKLPDGSTASLTVSVGLATYRETTFDAQNLIKQADECLYQAKSNGRNKVVQADSEEHGLAHLHI
jgi:diguanylate cyclase